MAPRAAHGHRAPTGVGLAAWIVLAVLAGAVRSAWAGDADLGPEGVAALEAGAAPDDDAPLLALLAEDATTSDADRALLHERLAARREARGEDTAAIDHRSWLVEHRGDAQDRVAFADLLVRIARRRASEGVVRGVSVTALLADALDVLAPLDRDALEPALRARAWFAEGWARFLRGDTERAAARLGSVDLDQLPEGWGPPLADILARCRHASGDFAGAAEAFLRAGNVHGAATAHAAARDASATARLYAELVLARPDDDALRAEALRAVRFAEAGALFASALRAAATAPDAPEALTALFADALVLGGALPEALEVYSRLHVQAPDLPGVRVALARLYGNRGRPEDLEAAVDLASAALAADPEADGAAELLWVLASADYEQLHRDDARGRILARCVRAQEALVRAQPGDAVAWSNLGNTLRVGGRSSEALAAYERAIEEDPLDPDIVSDQGLALSAAGRGAEALAAFERAIELEPGHLSAHQNAARHLLEVGRPADALPHLEAALASARQRSERTLPYRLLMGRAWRALRDAKASR